MSGEREHVFAAMRENRFILIKVTDPIDINGIDKYGVCYK